MPLDKIAKRYAERLFVQKIEDHTHDLEKQLEAITRKFAQRGMIQSGGYIETKNNTRIARVEYVAQARADSLWLGYEKARVQLSDLVVEGILAEVVSLCETQKKSLIKSSDEDIRRSFGPNAPSGFQEALNDEIERSIFRILASIRRELGIRLDESIMDARQEGTQKLEGPPLAPKTGSDRNNSIPGEEEVIFISCGQVTPEEIELGQAVVSLVTELTPFKPYFAENQNSLEGVTENILKALGKSVGLIAVMHPRGEVRGLEDEKHDRASVWIEQEIAIAAFISQALNRNLYVAVYEHMQVKREGLRDKLHLNPVRFSSHDEVVNALRKILPQWQSTHTPRNEGLLLEALFDYEEIGKTDEYTDYDLVVCLENNGTEIARDFLVEILFPKVFIRPNANLVEEVSKGGSITHRLFRIDHHYHGIKEFYPTKDIPAVIRIPYRIEVQHLTFKPNWLKQMVTATVFSGSMEPQKTETPISDLRVPFSKK